MEQSLPYLRSNPGCSDCDDQEVNDARISEAKDMVGKHCILELYDCDQIRLNDEAFLRTSITSAAKLAGATLLNLITHRFEPQGVTGLGLLAESHISIHTWPENGYAAVDVFTCGDHTMPERACHVLINELSAARYSLKSFERETPAELTVQVRKPRATEIASFRH